MAGVADWIMDESEVIPGELEITLEAVSKEPPLELASLTEPAEDAMATDRKGEPLTADNLSIGLSWG